MRYAVHQMFIELSAKALIAARSLCGGSLSVGMEYADLAVDNSVDQFLGLVNAVGNLGGKDGLAVKAGGFHVLVRRDDDAVAVRDFLGGEHVLRAARAVGFYLDGNAHLVARLGKRLGSHVGVGDTRGTGGDRQYAEAGLLIDRRRGSRSSSLLGELLCFLIVNDFQEFGGGLCRLQLGGEVLVHQHLHQARQHLEVNVAVEGRRDHEDQLAGSAVGGLVVHASGNGDGRESRRLNGFALGVRNGDLHTDGGGTHFFSGKNAFLVRCGVVQITASLVQLDENVDCLPFVPRGRVEGDALFFKQVGNTHKATSL